MRTIRNETVISTHTNDENNDDSCNDLLHQLIPISSRLDSGYLTCSSSYLTSPCRLSPSIVVYNEYESPQPDRHNESPVNAVMQKFHSTIDYENYVATRKHFDILTQLNNRNIYQIVDQILNYLSNQDLHSCLHVSKTWSFILNGYNQRKRTRVVKRNLFNNNSNEELSSSRNNKLTSTPMQTITNMNDIKSSIPFDIDITNVDQTSVSQSQHATNLSSEDNICLAASRMTFRYGYLKYLHGPTVPKRCPLCGFVSVVDVNDQHGICTNPFCRHDFCRFCSGPYHPSSPCKTTIGPVKSPWRQRASISPIFSNKTRNNLRRLLIR